VAARLVVVAGSEEEMVSRLPGRIELALRDDWFGGGSGLRLQGLEGLLRLGGLLGLLIGSGRIRRARTALMVLEASLEFLAYKQAFMSVMVGNQLWNLRKPSPVEVSLSEVAERTYGSYAEQCGSVSVGAQQCQRSWSSPHQGQQIHSWYPRSVCEEELPGSRVVT
jgi:hypothetical protein